MLIILARVLSSSRLESSEQSLAYLFQHSLSEPGLVVSLGQQRVDHRDVVDVEDALEEEENCYHVVLFESEESCQDLHD